MKLFRLFLFIGVMTFACELSAQTVYVTKTGKKYHKSNCHYMKNSKTEITFEKAIDLHYTACLICKPTANVRSLDIRSTSTKSTTTPTIKTTKSTQCTGKTKAGARCKRMTKSGNGRCYQH